MKTSNLVRFLFTLVTAALLVPDANAARYVVGLSPHYSRADGQMVLKSLLLFVLEGAAPGDELVVYDALNQAPVARFTLPKQGLFTSNARARAQQLKVEIAQVQQFLTGEHPRATAGDNAIHVPLFLDLVGTQLRRPGEALQVILIGSPLHLNIDDESFGMEASFPADGHLLVTQRESVFGTALKSKTLEGVTVHLAYLRPCFVNDYHQERVTRFWGLFAQLQGGGLVTFAPDLGLAFARAKDNVREPCMQAKVDTNDTKIEMRHVAPRSIPVWFGSSNLVQQVVEPVGAAPAVTGPATLVHPAPAPSAVESIQSTVVSEQPIASSAPVASLPVEVLPGKIGVGIMWSAPVDCDLYVKPSPSSRELYYRNTRSSQGRYYHDYRSANVGVDYEYVELDSSIDLSAVGVWVNYYKGRTANVRGIVVVHFNGRTYQGEFTLAAPLGNGGQESQSRSSSRYWTRIDLLKLTGISVSPHANPLESSP